MNFLSPEALAFAVTLPVVVVFYLLKRRRVARLVSSTVLWQRFLNETQANSPFQKLRHNLSQYKNDHPKNVLLSFLNIYKHSFPM